MPRSRPPAARAHARQNEGDAARSAPPRAPYLRRNPRSASPTTSPNLIQCRAPGRTAFSKRCPAYAEIALIRRFIVPDPTTEATAERVDPLRMRRIVRPPSAHIIRPTGTRPRGSGRAGWLAGDTDRVRRGRGIYARPVAALERDGQVRSAGPRHDAGGKPARPNEPTP